MTDPRIIAFSYDGTLDPPEFRIATQYEDGILGSFIDEEFHQEVLDFLMKNYVEEGISAIRKEMRKEMH